LVEGPTLVAEALAPGVRVAVQQVFHEVGAYDDLVGRARAQAAEVHPVAAGVLGSVLTTVTPQPIVAVGRPEPADAPSVVARAEALGRPVVILAGVSDPGNAGALLRTAEAA